MDAKKYNGDWASIVEGLSELTEVISNPLAEVDSVMKKLSNGDFGVSITGDYNGSFLSLKNSVNTTVKNVSHYISDISGILLEMSKNNFNY